MSQNDSLFPSPDTADSSADNHQAAESFSAPFLRTEAESASSFSPSAQPSSSLSEKPLVGKPAAQPAASFAQPARDSAKKESDTKKAADAEKKPTQAADKNTERKEKQEKPEVPRQVYVPLHSLDDETVIAPFRHALVLGKDTALRALDRTALRLAGVRKINCLGSGEEAITMLAQRGRSRWVPLFDIILCDMQLLDMTAYDFLEEVRDMAVKAHIPIFLVVPTTTTQTVLDALSRGISGVVTRPYTPSTLVIQLAIAYNVVKTKRADLVKASQAMLIEQETLAQQVEILEKNACSVEEVSDSAAENLLEEAKALAEQGDYNQAIDKLEKNLENPAFVADSCAELAKVWEAKGDKAEAAKYRELAYDLYVDDKNWGEAQKIEDALEKTSKSSAKKELVGEIGVLIKQGRYAEAAPIVAAVKQSPQKLDKLLQEISRACQLMPVPQRAIENLVAALGRIGEAEYGQKLYTRLLGETSQNMEKEVDDRGFFERTFPTLYTVAAIARYTAKSYKKKQQK